MLKPFIATPESPERTPQPWPHKGESGAITGTRYIRRKETIGTNYNAVRKEITESTRPSWKQRHNA